MENHSGITVEERGVRLRNGMCLSLMFALISFAVALLSTAATGNHISKCTEETMGEVVSFGHGRYSAGKIYAAFTVDGVRYMTEGRYNSGDFTDEEKSSEKAPVKVWYEKGNPANAYANRSPVTYLPVAIVPLVFVVSALVMLVWLVRLKRAGSATTDTTPNASIDSQEDGECP